MRFLLVSARLVPSLISLVLWQAPCPVCSGPISIDLDADAIDQDQEKLQKAKQGILGRMDLTVSLASLALRALLEQTERTP